MGLNALTLLPVLVLITLSTALSYRLECQFRYGHPAVPGMGQSGLACPAMTVLVAVFSVGLQGPLLGRLFIGERSHTVGTTANMKRIGGTTVDTVHCFREPTDPIARRDGPDPCTATVREALPTLFSLGDSHNQVLIPLGEKLLAGGRFNVAFMDRGGCPVPCFSRWGEGAEVPPRYRLCRPYAEKEVSRVLARLRPGDRVVLVSNLAAIEPAQRLQERISGDLSGTCLFSPFDSLCPPEQRVCSSVRAGTLLYSDETHLTNAGALLLYPRLMAFLADQTDVEPPPS